MIHRIDLWGWRLRADASLDTLSPDERTRAGRFIFCRDRDRYVAGRVRLRAILSLYTGLAPDAIKFRYGQNGRPGIDGPCFNLSHSGDLALLAIGDEAPLGADIEARRPISLDVAQSHFAPDEICSLRALPEPQRQAAFFRCWTRKEAYLKARGTGLATDLSSFTVTLNPGQPPLLTRCTSGEAVDWSLHDIPLPPGLAGAIALRSQQHPVQMRWRSHFNA
ncbi:MAG: 4'-phosphopantetheinyl transferase family protein [Pararhodobacter sp.]